MSATRLDAAWALAVKAHQGQKYGPEPYIYHIQRVVLRLEDTEDQVVACLHDTLEDTAVTLLDLRRQFGRLTTLEVFHLTRRADERYVEYIHRLRKLNNERVLRVKCADLAENLWHAQQPDFDVDKKHLLRRYEGALSFLSGRTNYYYGY